MNELKPDVPDVLASDLDGTLLPLDGHDENRQDLLTLSRKLTERRRCLVYVTGRHFASTDQVIRSCQLPAADWIICDVGTSVYRRDSGGYQPVPHYLQLLERIMRPMALQDLKKAILAEMPGLVLQEPEKQGAAKLSFYADANELGQVKRQLAGLLNRIDAPYSMITSVDPFSGTGLVDLLPRGVSKARALEWWMNHTSRQRQSIVFAGDSGNDLAALTAGFCSIVVGNAHLKIRHRAMQAHRKSGWTHRLYLARKRATSGVLEGCRWFGLVPH